MKKDTKKNEDTKIKRKMEENKKKISFVLSIRSFINN